MTTIEIYYLRYDEDMDQTIKDRRRDLGCGYNPEQMPTAAELQTEVYVKVFEMKPEDETSTFHHIPRDGDVLQALRPREGGSKKTLETLNRLYQVFNDYYQNPLSVSKNWTAQQYVQLMKTHTSMSVGDVIVIDGTHFVVANIGFSAIV